MVDGFVGQKVKKIRAMTSAELKAEMWEDDRFHTAMVVELENGAKFYASRDDEGNGAGAMFAVDDKGQQVGFNVQE